jgi:hypothetical protein
MTGLPPFIADRAIDCRPGESIALQGSNAMTRNPETLQQIVCAKSETIDRLRFFLKLSLAANLLFVVTAATIFDRHVPTLLGGFG